jgi:hypothetical protein
VAELETPDDPESVYLARSDEVGEHRPTFTSDVYRLEDDRLVMILQHPCALRSGPDLHPKLLVAVVDLDTLRSNWAKAPFAKMPLPKLVDGNDYSADFVDLDTVESALLVACDRVAVLSHFGVNLLMQRWMHHSTRLAVPTHTYSDATIAQFDEADLVEEWVDDRVDEGAEAKAAEDECESWLNVKVGDRRRRALLGDRQQASSVRRDARAHRKSVKLLND